MNLVTVSGLVMLVGGLLYLLPGAPAPERLGRLSTMGLVMFGVGLFSLLVRAWR
jgi:hypothetical protein